MAKTFKEYMSYIGGFRIGNLDSFQPMPSLGDTPPKGQGGRDSRGVGLNSGSRDLPLKANYTGQAPGTMRPFLKAQTNTIITKICVFLSQHWRETFRPSRNRWSISMYFLPR